MAKTYLVLWITLFSLLGLTQCSKRGTSEGEINLKGTLAATDYTTARLDIFDKVWAVLVEGFTFASATQVTDVWAIPLYSGEFHPTVFNYVIKGTVTSNSVSLNLSKKNWVAILLDSTKAAKKDQVVGYVTMTAGSAGLTSMPLGNASSNIDLGELTKNASSDETSSSKTATDNATALSLSVDQLSKMAISDDSIKTVKNAYRNYDGSTFLSIKPFFVWSWSGAASSITDTYSNIETLVASKFQGYLFYMNTNSSAMDYSAVCAQTKALTLTPPTTVTNVSGGTSWTTTSPLDSTVGTKSTSGNSCGAGNLYLRDDSATYGSYQFNFSASNVGGNNEYLAPPIPTGDWTVKVGSTEIGKFESNVGTIFVGDNTTKPIVFLPSIKVNKSGNNVASVEVKWYLRNSTTGVMEEVTDGTLLDQMSSLNIGITDYSTSPRTEEMNSSTINSTTGYKFTPTKTFAMNTGLSFSVSYVFNNVSIFVDYRL